MAFLSENVSFNSFYLFKTTNRAKFAFSAEFLIKFGYAKKFSAILTCER